MTEELNKNIKEGAEELTPDNEKDEMKFGDGVGIFIIIILLLFAGIHFWNQLNEQQQELAQLREQIEGEPEITIIENSNENNGLDDRQ